MRQSVVMGSTIDEPSAMPDFDQRVLSLCDELWTAEARKHGALLYLAAFTGFGTEPAYETPEGIVLNAASNRDGILAALAAS